MMIFYPDSCSCWRDWQWQVHPAAPVPAGGRLCWGEREDDLRHGAAEDRRDESRGSGGSGEEGEAGSQRGLQYQVSHHNVLFSHLTLTPCPGLMRISPATTPR